MNRRPAEARSALLKQNLRATYPTVSHGQGVFLYDQEGNRYLDGSSGAMTASIGHGVAEIATAMARQAERVAFTYRTQFTSEPAEELARRITSLAPGDLNTAFFVSSGSEATEFAIRATASHWREQGRPVKDKVLGRQISYHGMTMGALSMSGHAARRPDYASLLHPFPVAPPAYAYRYARPGESDTEYADRAAAEIEAAILDVGPDSVGAFIAEPIVGAAGGVLVPPRGYLARVREICDRLEVLLILDEVITGMGRTGAWFAAEEERVVPDLLVLGKGMSGGYSPMAAVLMRDHMVKAIEEGSGVAPFGHTYSGNPLGAATSLAVLDLIERENVLENVVARGAQLGQGLADLSARRPCMADVRGRGLLWGFEFVTDHRTRAAPHPKHNAAGVFVADCLDAGLIIYPAGIPPLNNAVLLSPPLTITEDEINHMLGLLEVALMTMDARVADWAATS